MSRALYIPSHYPIHSHYAYYPDYFVSIYNAYKEGNEEILKKYEELPQESFELILLQEQRKGIVQTFETLRY